MSLRFALTAGEPAGIGPDLCLMLAHEMQPYPVIVISNRQLLSERAAQLGLKVELLDVQPDAWPNKPAPADSMYVWDTPLYEPVVTGQLNQANAQHVLETLTRAGQGCLDGVFSAMITKKMNKSLINDAGGPSSG